MDFNRPFGPQRGRFTCKTPGCNNRVWHSGFWKEKISGVECVECLGERLARKLLKEDK